MMMIRPFKKLSAVNAIMQKAFAASTRIYEVLNVEPKIKSEPGAWEIKEIRDQVELRGVWFRYEETDVLKDINVRCRKGEVVALVGVSGAGKSTLVDLIPRFYDPQKGGVFIDGRMSATRRQVLERLIGMVTQATILFNDSVKDNIAYASPE
jgi:subfamily B ATP-binding cassette protein MsbA